MSTFTEDTVGAMLRHWAAENMTFWGPRTPNEVVIVRNLISRLENAESLCKKQSDDPYSGVPKDVNTANARLFRVADELVRETNKVYESVQMLKDVAGNVRPSEIPPSLWSKITDFIAKEGRR